MDSTKAEEATKFDERLAAYRFVESMRHMADLVVSKCYPAWYGWALRRAFLAGAKWQRERNAEV